RVNCWVAEPAEPASSTIGKLYAPPVPAAGVPVMLAGLPVLKVSPLGNVKAVVAAFPFVSTSNDPYAPTVNVAELGPRKTGASTTVRVYGSLNTSIIPAPTATGVKSTEYPPVVPAGGVPLRVAVPSPLS